MTSAPAPDPESLRVFVGEVFHALSQPLTALQCSLELSLQRDQTVEELRASLETALELAGRLRQQLSLVRALNDATDPGDLSWPTDLSELLLQLREDMRPLFESAAKTFSLKLDAQPLLVRADKAKLMRGLFCFLEHLFRHLPPSAVLAVGVNVSGRQARINIHAASCLPVSPCQTTGDSPYSCEIELARRTFLATGGEFAFVSSNGEQNLWQASVPLA